MDDNQITGYYGGAMRRAGMLSLADAPPEVDAVVIGPNDPAAMMRLSRECRERGVPFVFDPAHQLPHLSGSDLDTAATGAWILIGNDYEIELVKQRMSCDDGRLLECAEMVVTTLGRQGSRIAGRHGVAEIPPAPARREVDPTGAGDAYRAGLVAGLLRGLDVATAGRVASLAATYAIEQVGTAEHSYSTGEFADRFGDAFGAPLPARFFS
jgi:adenosine kinase